MIDAPLPAPTAASPGAVPLPKRPLGDAGFGLLEAIVALAIASLVMAALYRAQSGALRASVRAQAHEAAVLLARSHLESLGGDGFLRSGITQGSYGQGVRWRLSVQSLAKGDDAPTTLRPYWLQLEAFDRYGRPLIQLETAKIAREGQ